MASRERRYQRPTGGRVGRAGRRGNYSDTLGKQSELISLSWLPEAHVSMSFGRRWSWLFIFGGCVVIVALIAIFGALGDQSPWAPDADRIAKYHEEQCEKVYVDAFFLQFHNFWSNFIFFAGGLLILFFNRSMPGSFVGSAMVFLFFGSAGFHGTLTSPGQTMDMIGVYAVLLTIIAYAFIEVVGWEYRTWPTWAIMIGAVVLAVIGGIIRRSNNFFESGRFAALTVIIIVIYMVTAAFVPAARLRIEPVAQGNMLWSAGIAVLAGVLALLFKFTDGADNWPSECLYGPSSIVQGHALWHFFAGIMFVAMFEYFRALRMRSDSPFPWRHP
jgi:hypothetical protein